MARKPKAIQVPGEQFDPTDDTPRPIAPVTPAPDAEQIGMVRFGMVLTRDGWVARTESE